MREQDAGLCVSAGGPIATGPAFVAVMPTELRGKDAYLAGVGEALRFPDWWGRNWDALRDCLGSLYEIEEHVVVMWHAALPQLDGPGFEAYCDILGIVVHEWERVDEGHTLVIVGPAALVERVEAARRACAGEYAAYDERHRRPLA